METVTKLGFAFITLLIIFIVVEAVTTTHCIPEVQYDRNGDGAVDIIDVSIQIDMLNKTIEQAKLNNGQE